MMKYPLRILVTAILCFTGQLSAQTEDSSRTNFLKVYLDGVSYYHDHIKTEITFVDYMRDRFDAQVHLMITSQSTGSGGADFTVFFLGQKEFEGKNDTLHYYANTNNTEDEIRRGIEQIIKMGLLPYIAKLPTPTTITISYESDSSKETELEEADKWDGWVYSASTYLNVSLSKYYRSYSISGGLSASKVTEEWKLKLGLGGNSNTDNYDFGDGFVNEYKNNSWYANAAIVNSLDDHWSVGGVVDYYAATYSNYDLLLSVLPAIEYNIFPYSESTTEQLTFFYTIGPSYAIYTDTTIYNQKEELLFKHRMDISLSLKQKWGSASVGLNGSNYLHDISKNSFGCFTSFNWRLFEGFSINGYFVVDFIHDQLNLPKSGVTEEEILLQIAELETNFSFYTFFGISYTFGSIYNNVVNPRFEGGNNSFYF